MLSTTISSLKALTLYKRKTSKFGLLDKDLNYYVNFRFSVVYIFWSFVIVEPIPGLFLQYLHDRHW